MTQYIAELDKIRTKSETFLPIDYKETFDQFCKAMLATDLLDETEKALIRGLLIQWEANKRRHNG